jgi:hypothetical protein
MGVGKVPVITVTRVPTTTELDCYWGRGRKTRKSKVLTI